jgi:hypothetical protein
MGMDIYGTDHMKLSYGGWAKVLKVAYDHGWKPMGTRLDTLGGYREGKVDADNN